MERDDGAFDWDAAFEALVAPLRPPRYRRVARAAWQTVAIGVLMATACWTVLRVVGDQLDQFGRPWL